MDTISLQEQFSQLDAQSYKRGNVSTWPPWVIDLVAGGLKWLSGRRAAKEAAEEFNIISKRKSEMLISKFDNDESGINVELLEGMYDIVLPDEYKKFLIKYNGGKTPETKFNINGVSSDIQGFLGLGNAEESYHFDRLKNSVRIYEWLKSEMFPIAFNTFGDYIMIRVNGNANRGIYFYYHDKPSKYIELAEDFVSFVKKCKSKKIGHIRSIEERKNDLINLGKGDKITPEKVAGWQAEIDEYANIHQEELKID